MDADASPFPSDDSTPPVMKMCLVDLAAAISSSPLANPLDRSLDELPGLGAAAERPPAAAAAARFPRDIAPSARPAHDRRDAAPEVRRFEGEGPRRHAAEKRPPRQCLDVVLKPRISGTPSAPGLV
jgi:hypothetical protein